MTGALQRRQKPSCAHPPSQEPAAAKLAGGAAKQPGRVSPTTKIGGGLPYHVLLGIWGVGYVAPETCFRYQFASIDMMFSTTHISHRLPHLMKLCPPSRRKWAAKLPVTTQTYDKACSYPPSFFLFVCNLARWERWKMQAASSITDITALT